MEKFEKTKVEDLKNSEVPDSLYWSVDQVCDFFEKLNLPEYKVISNETINLKAYLCYFHIKNSTLYERTELMGVNWSIWTLHIYHN